MRLMFAGERIEKAYLLIRGPFVFTSKQLLSVDKQGLTGSPAPLQEQFYQKLDIHEVQSLLAGYVLG